MITDRESPSPRSGHFSPACRLEISNHSQVRGEEPEMGAIAYVEFGFVGPGERGADGTGGVYVEGGWLW